MAHNIYWTCYYLLNMLQVLGIRSSMTDNELREFLYRMDKKRVHDNGLQ